MPQLDPENTDAGAMERLMLLETYSPARLGLYDRQQSLRAMRLMRQVIENRLKAPSRYSAPGARDPTDIVRLGNQFAGFRDYPTLPSSLRVNLINIVRIANDDGDQRAAAYSNFVQDAITAATEKLPALGAIDVTATGWRTAAHASPGMNFRVITTLQGNTFFATSPVPPMPHHKRRPRRT
jgi:hypothetical protein